MNCGFLEESSVALLEKEWVGEKSRSFKSITTLSLATQDCQLFIILHTMSSAESRYNVYPW